MSALSAAPRAATLARPLSSRKRGTSSSAMSHFRSTTRRSWSHFCCTTMSTSSIALRADKDDVKVTCTRV